MDFLFYLLFMTGLILLIVLIFISYSLYRAVAVYTAVNINIKFKHLIENRQAAMVKVANECMNARKSGNNLLTNEKQEQWDISIQNYLSIVDTFALYIKRRYLIDKSLLKIEYGILFKEAVEKDVFSKFINNYPNIKEINYKLNGNF